VTAVFVYGTLMRGGRYHRLLAGAPYAGSVSTAPRYQLLDLGPYPGLVAGQQRVQGELYDVSAAIIERLDALEGHPDHYRRSAIVLADGREVTGYLLVDPAASARGQPIATWPP